MSHERARSATDRLKTTSAKLRGIKPNKSSYDNDKPSSDLDHRPFITKVQVRIKSTRNGLDATQSTGAADDLDNTSSYPKPSNATSVSENSTDSTSIEKDSCNNECKFHKSYQFYEERKEEKKKRRRKMLGELACARYTERESRETDELLYRPRLSSRECSVELLLVRELTDHLDCVSKNTDTAKRKNIAKSTVFHARQTKGERKFGVRR